MFVNISKEQIYQRSVYLFIFLFPIAGMSLRGWNAYLFSVLVILGLMTLKREGAALYKDEKILLRLFFIGFLIFVISSLVNGWDGASTKALGTELMFLLFIPLYLLIRRFDDSGKWLLRGVIAGGFVLGLQSGYELSYLHQSRGMGVYSPIIYGSFAVLYAFITVGTIQFDSRKVLYWLTLALSFGMAFYAAAFSGSRGAYVAIPILLVALVFVRYRDWRGGVILGFGLALVVAAYFSVPYVQSRADQAINNSIGYFNESNNVSSKIGNTSAGVRLEMWKTAWLIYIDHPLFGVGRGHYQEATKTYVAQGLVNKHVSDHGHPHNMYFDFLASNGTGGFIVVIFMLLYPAVIFYQKREQHRDSSTAGFLFILAYASFSMFEASTFQKVNFLSTFLLFLAVLFSWHVKNIHSDDAKSIGEST